MSMIQPPADAVDNAAAWVSRRLDDGGITLPILPVLMARFGLSPRAALGALVRGASATRGGMSIGGLTDLLMSEVRVSLPSRAERRRFDKGRAALAKDVAAAIIDAVATRH